MDDEPAPDARGQGGRGGQSGQRGHGGQGEPSLVVQNFLTSDGRLHTMPAKRTKRLLVLDHVAQRFEPGVMYAEKDVNAILERFSSDYAALRRALVDEEFLTRENNVYWRSGGTVEI
jgi:hypothetical protein